MLQEKYLNLFTDFGFKKLFGEEPNKDLLISFLNTLLPEKHQIQYLTYSSQEYQGYTKLDRKAIFDLSCVSSSGERFVVELQKAKQNFFKDRSVYYATFPIQAQAKRGMVWDFKLAAVYTIGILDFLFDEQKQENDQQVIHHVQLKNQDNQIFYDKLTFIYLTLPNFNKTEHELETLQEKWFYLFRHLHELQEIPQRLQEKILIKAFEIANIARLEPEQRKAYEDSLKYYRDLKNVTDTAWGDGHKQGIELGIEQGIELGIKQGVEQGIELGIKQGVEQGVELGIEQGKKQQAEHIARSLLGLLDVETIAAKTGLTVAEIQQLSGLES